MNIAVLILFTTAMIGLLALTVYAAIDLLRNIND
jgi:hypothetical protein